MTNKKGFTLVELLAVIVILGIILLIAVPKITSTISSATEASMESSAKMLAASGEREFTVSQTLGTTLTTMSCVTAATLSATDYDLDNANTDIVCKITFDGSGNATVQLCGKSGGKFAGKCVCGATRLTADAQTKASCAA